jgi:hypothetical protein
MKIGNSVFEVVNKDGKLFIKHTFNGEYFQNEDLMMVYGLNSKPFVKRLGKKMYLTEELVKELSVATF